MEAANKSMVRDLTGGNVFSTLIAFSWPLMLSNLLQVVYNLVDMVIVGRFVGSAGLSAVSCGGDLLHLVTALCMGFCSAGQVVISQHIGRNDQEGVKKTVGTLFSLVALTAVACTVLGLLLSDWLLQLINVPQEACADARAYTRCCFWGLLFIFGYNAVSAILRGMGDSKRPLLFIAIAAISNLILDLVFVAGFGWGPWGAALATVIGQGLSLLLSLIYLYAKRRSFCFDFALGSFKMDPPTVKVLCKLGVPMALQHGAVMLSKIFVHSFVNSYGVTASAVNAVGNKIGQAAMVVSNAFATGGTSIIGQSFGAGKKNRVKQVVYASLGTGLAYSLVLCVIMIAFPEQVFGLFNRDPEVLALCHSYVLIAVMQFIGFALRSPMLALINGTGASELSLIVGLLDGIVARIGFSFLLGQVLGMGIVGFWLGDVIASQIPFLVGGVYFWGGFWLKRSVAVAPQEATAKECKED